MIITIAITTLIFIILYFKLSRTSKKVPQGLIETPIEKGIPLIGALYKIWFPLHDYFISLGKRHGPLFRVRFAMRDILVLNDFDTIQKALKDNGDTFSGRWTSKYVKELSHDSGIILYDGDKWAKQRSFVLKVLRDFGLGKSRSVEIVQDECLSLLKDVELSEGKGFEFSKLIPYHTANIISKFIMNKRFSQDDPNLHLIEKVITMTAKQKDIGQLISLMCPVFDDSALVYRFMKAISRHFDIFDKIDNFFRLEMEEHSKELDLNSEGEDLMDRFLIKQHQLKETEGHVDSFTDWQLIRISLELFIAGYETTSTTLTWSFMFLSRYPDIQKQVYNEIIDQIGSERLPTMNDKKSLQYTQAVMDEILRLSTVAPLGVFHKTLKDCSVNQYFIPKNIIVFPNLFACHTDANIWEKPKEFYPEHFLSKDDNGVVKYSPREQLIPFGIGPRQCLGESLARTEYFIFFISLLQKFQVSFAEEISDSKYQEILRGNDGVLRYSIEDRFVFRKRKREGSIL